MRGVWGSSLCICLLAFFVLPSIDLRSDKLSSLLMIPSSTSAAVMGAAAVALPDTMRVNTSVTTLRCSSVSLRQLRMLLKFWRISFYKNVMPFSIHANHHLFSLPWRNQKWWVSKSGCHLSRHRRISRRPRALVWVVLKKADGRGECSMASLFSSFQSVYVPFSHSDSRIWMVRLSPPAGK